MANPMARMTVLWQGWAGAPGVTQLYFDAGTISQTDVNAVRTFFDGCKAGLPIGLNIQVPSSGDLVNDFDGKLSGAWSVGVTPAAVVGTAGGGYAGNAGAVVHWLTNTVEANRRVRGRTFLVPLAGAVWDTDGSLLAGTVDIFRNAATALVVATAGRMLVWHRPLVQKGTGAILRQGSSAPVTSTRVPDLAVSLRSRRT